MAFLDWNSSYSVGVEKLDQQHSSLFNLVNELYSAMLKGQSQAMTAEMLDALVAYTEEHFAAEEALMAAAGYPKLESHIADHRELTARVQEFLSKLELGEGVENLPVLYFMNEWLTTHILKVDLEYSPWLKAVKPVPGAVLDADEPLHPACS
jgi:hemerythrin